MLLVGGLATLAYLTGERHRARWTDKPYESGIAPVGPPRSPGGIEFYQVAVYFVLLDVQTALVLAWSVAARSLGRSAFVEMAVFVLLLLTGLAYLWKTGSLDWRKAERASSRHGEPHE